ncbi:MAG TPA: MGMT family protein [Patescibacteria group bacterium]|nr:MGMT family protein [Patescibacteria group bacterium]
MKNTILKTPDNNSDYVQEVYDVVGRIPKGKVAIYAQVAAAVTEELKRKKIRKRVSPRQVGSFLHKNPDPNNIPCHRVVDRRGKVAENYAFGGGRIQKRKLQEEGVRFKSKNCVDLTKHIWQPKS